MHNDTVGVRKIAARRRLGWPPSSTFPGAGALAHRELGGLAAGAVPSHEGGVKMAAFLRTASWMTRSAMRVFPLPAQGGAGDMVRV